MKYANIQVNQTSIAVISYNAAHRKTQDLLRKLKGLGYVNVTVLAIPFVKRENPFTPVYAHRPPTEDQTGPKELCQELKFGFRTVEINDIAEYLDHARPDYTMIAGAGLLPDELVEKHKLINVHPGWLPKVRGLDSLKWAIHNSEPLGVTAHFVDAEADAGYLIDQRPVPVFKKDSFQDVAFRQYEIEIDMLANSPVEIANRTNFPSLHTDKYKATRRMPKATEENLMKEFELYKDKFAQ